MASETCGPTAHTPAVTSHDGAPSSVTTFLNLWASVPRPKPLARLFGRSPIPRSLHNQYRNARGDIAVIESLTHLGSEWVVRTCVAQNEGEEHVVLGPPGIFSVVVRHPLAGAVWIDGGVIVADGERLPYLREAEFSAVRLSQVLSDAVGTRVETTPCLVLVGQRSVTVAKPPRRVAVMTVRELRHWLKGMRRVLTDTELVALKKVVSAHQVRHDHGASSAAQFSPTAGDDLAAFRRVLTEVSQARHVRLTWMTGALVLFWLVAVVGVGGLVTSLVVG